MMVNMDETQKKSGSALSDLVMEHEESYGCQERLLGVQSMPEGYALMINADRTHFYWLRHDGTESVIHWDKWAVYKWAKHDAQTAA